jgi:HD-GYP domain-containing protein (c-di-GMP phosphodiesterase class II)
MMSPFKLFDTIHGSGRGLSDKLAVLHNQIRERHADVDRMAIALYDTKTDLLKTFVNSDKSENVLLGYQAPLAAVPSLKRIADSGTPRVIDDLQDALSPASEHSHWLLEHDYRSSFTLPIRQDGDLIGFLFFDSLRPRAFGPEVVRDLDVYARLITLTVAQELTAIKTLVGSVQMARDFAHLRDLETGVHLDRMARYARLIARKLAPRVGLTDEFVEHVFLFAPLHDIGKIGVPDTILLKAGRLDEHERRIMQTHVAKGCEMIDRIIEDFSLTGLPNVDILRNIVAAHHERIDGSGYPQGLTHKDIPLEASVVAIADVFDALTSPRPYKRPWSNDEACSELRKMCAAGKLDPDCVAGLTENMPEIEQIQHQFAVPAG